MTYDQLQDSFESKAIFSADSPMINWTGQWDSETFADDSIPEKLVANAVVELVFTGVHGKGKIIYSERIQQPTIKDVMIFLDRAMDVTGDESHPYFEGFHVDGDKFHMIMGS